METKYPDLLTSISGEKITNAKQWEGFRRDEILSLFKNFVYGVRPIERPDDLTFTLCSVTKNFMDGKTTYKKLKMTFNNYTVPFKLFVPNDAKKPVPAFIYVMLANQAEKFDLEKEPNATVVPIEDITSRGYAVAVFSVTDIDPDNYDGFKDGVHGVFQPNPEMRTKESWGTIAAWAWGASRIMDYLETDADVDCKKVGVVGHSRGGKTALWCSATDERFALAVSNNSGCTGASLSRSKIGESLKSINTTFPHWFCENYKKYGDNEDMLPIDQHMLLALIAPRLLYVTSSKLDEWADPRNELKSCILASSVYELYGKKGLVIDGKPELNISYADGDIAYHIKEGEHSIAPFDWEKVMDFADVKFKLWEENYEKQ